MKKIFLPLLLLGANYASAFGAVEEYRVDPAHSSVGFQILHFFTPVYGSFEKFQGSLTIDRDNLENSSAEAVIEVASVDTQQNMRDKDLRSTNFFHAARYPKITFKTTSWQKTEEENVYTVTGDLTMLDTTRPITLSVEALGFGPGMQGNFISGWKATGKINRDNWEISSGKPAVGSSVAIEVLIEAIRQ